MLNKDWLDSFKEKYDIWLLSARKHLEKENWKEGFKDYPFINNESAPIALFKKELKDSKIALISTAGFYIKNKQIPFNSDDYEGDYSYKEIPSSTSFSSLGIAHNHYDKKYALSDPNVVYPVERLKELENEGFIKSLYDTLFSIQGYIPQIHNFLRTSAIDITTKLTKSDVDAVLLVPV